MTSGFLRRLAARASGESASSPLSPMLTPESLPVSLSPAAGSLPYSVTPRPLVSPFEQPLETAVSPGIVDQPESIPASRDRGDEFPVPRRAEVFNTDRNDEVPSAVAGSDGFSPSAVPGRAGALPSANGADPVHGGEKDPSADGASAVRERREDRSAGFGTAAEAPMEGEIEEGARPGNYASPEPIKGEPAGNIHSRVDPMSTHPACEERIEDKDKTPRTREKEHFSPADPSTMFPESSVTTADTPERPAAEADPGIHGSSGIESLTPKSVETQQITHLEVFPHVPERNPSLTSPRGVQPVSGASADTYGNSPAQAAGKEMPPQPEKDRRQKPARETAAADAAAVRKKEADDSQTIAARTELPAPEREPAHMPVPRGAHALMPARRGGMQANAGMFVSHGEPAVVVHIGRVEVRAVTVPPPPRPAEPRRGPRLSLDEYLKRGGGSGS